MIAMTWLWIFSFVLLGSMAYAALSGAPWVPTWKGDIDRAKRLLDLKSGETFIELGCGDGRVTIGVSRGSFNAKRELRVCSESLFTAPFCFVSSAKRAVFLAVALATSRRLSRFSPETPLERPLEKDFEQALRGGGLRAVGVELSLVQWIAAQIRRVLTRSWNTRFVLGNAFSYDLRNADAVYVFLMPETYQKLRPKLEAELKPGARVLSYVWPIEGWTPEVIDEFPNTPRLFLYRR